MTPEYKLMKEDVLLEELFDQTVDQPWFICHFVPTPEFESVRTLFEENQFDELLRQGVRLVDADTGKSNVSAAGYVLPMSFFVQGNEASLNTI